MDPRGSKKAIPGFLTTPHVADGTRPTERGRSLGERMKREHGAFALVVTIFATYVACVVFACWFVWSLLGWIPAAIMLAVMVVPILIPGSGGGCSGGYDCDYGGDE